MILIHEYIFLTITPSRICAHGNKIRKVVIFPFEKYIFHFRNNRRTFDFFIKLILHCKNDISNKLRVIKSTSKQDRIMLTKVKTKLVVLAHFVANDKNRRGETIWVRLESESQSIRKRTEHSKCLIEIRSWVESHYR